jgi:predicted TIM-barrel fold metal-dependent hydrolase
MPGFFAHGAQDVTSGVCGCCTTSRRGFLRALSAGAGALALPAIARAQTPAAQVTPYKIDAHHHFYPPHVQNYPGVANPLIRAWTPQRSVEELDKNAVKTAMLSMASVPLGWFKQDAQTSRKFVRDINDYGAKMVQDHPGRFGLFAYLSMLDVEGTLKEIDYAFGTLKADGVNISTGWIDKYPGDPMFAPIFEELNRRKAVVYLHPTTQACCGGALPGVGDSWIEVPHDTTRAIVSLLFSGAIRKYRDVKFLWSHGGGTVPMLVDRIDWLSKAQVKNRAELLPDGVHAELRRFFYDTANAGYPGSMAALTKLVDTSHIVFGTDYPYVTTEWNAKALRDAGLPADQIRAIEAENALQLIPRLKA